LVEALRYKPKGRGFDSWWCQWHNPFRSHYGPGVDSASNRNEYQEYFLGAKAAGASSSARVKERLDLYLYSPSGPSWSVVGRTLPLPLTALAGCSLQLTRNIFCDAGTEVLYII
jgi:hypothetical protein